MGSEDREFKSHRPDHFSSDMQSNTISATESASLIHEIPSILERINLKNLFPKELPLEVELGSGDGSFLAEYAKRHPDRNFIGVERLMGRMRKLEKKGRRLGLVNLRGVKIESSYFVEYLLPKQSVEAFHIYFPDPWPKRKHRRHRLINERFPELAHQVLLPGGRVYLRTDDQDYFEQMVSVFAPTQVFEKIETPVELSELLTDFERDFRAKGVETLRAAYQAR